MVEAQTTEDTPITIDVLSGASDIDGDTLSISNVSEASNGSLEIVDGKIQYTPNENYNGAEIRSDGNGGEITKSLVITIDAVNDNPQSSMITAEATEDNIVQFDVLAGATDVDGDA